MCVCVCVRARTRVHAQPHERVTCETISQQAEHYRLQVVLSTISTDQTLLLVLVLHDQLHGLDCTGPEEVPLTQTQYNTFPKSLFITLHNTQFQPTTFY